MRRGEFGRLSPREARLLLEAVKMRELRVTRRFAVLATRVVGGNIEDHFPELQELIGEPTKEELGLKIATAFGIDAEKLKE